MHKMSRSYVKGWNWSSCYSLGNKQTDQKLARDFNKHNKLWYKPDWPTYHNFMSINHVFIKVALSIEIGGDPLLFAHPTFIDQSATFVTPNHMLCNDRLVDWKLNWELNNTPYLRDLHNIYIEMTNPTAMKIIFVFKIPFFQIVNTKVRIVVWLKAELKWIKCTMNEVKLLHVRAWSGPLTHFTRGISYSLLSWEYALNLVVHRWQLKDWLCR